MKAKIVCGISFILIFAASVGLYILAEETIIRQRDNRLLALQNPFPANVKVGSVQKIDSGAYRYGVMVTSREVRP